jgi:hypothetical protein
MVSTSPFDGEVEGSSPSPRTYNSTSLPAPCRRCGGPSWLADEDGAIHPCCELHRAGKGRPCLACKSSEMLNREQRRRGKKHISQPSAYKGVDGEL